MVLTEDIEREVAEDISLVDSRQKRETSALVHGLFAFPGGMCTSIRVALWMIDFGVRSSFSQITAIGMLAATSRRKSSSHDSQGMHLIATPLLNDEGWLADF